jgi:protein farnesyltransferase/geranylgeranyltransferase type-1 subunit alpha
MESGEGLVTDIEVVEREINYAKDHISWAPNNPSPWNYLKGVLKRAHMCLSDMQVFCEGFVGGKGADLMKSVGEGGQVRSSIAIDWLSEIYAEAGDMERCRECLEALAEKWDPIRRRYWEYRGRLMQEEKKETHTTVGEGVSRLNVSEVHAAA